MSGVRALRADDLGQVVALYRAHLAWPHVADEAELIASFERLYLNGPLTDHAIPSLVYEGADARVVGFLGSMVHPMLFEQRPVRLATSGALVVAPDARRVAAGALLLRAYLAGPQDLTITDTAGDSTARMWTRLGGAEHHLSSLQWLYPLHPLRTAVGIGLWRLGRHRWLRFARPVCRPLDAVYARYGARDDGDGADDDAVEPLSARLLTDHLCLGRQRRRLWPDHDRESLDRLFAEIGRSRANGRLVRSLVRDARGQPLGWYILALLPYDVCYVLHLAAAPRHEQRMLSHVLRRARQLDASAVAGRLEPWLVEVLPPRAVMFPRLRFLYHSRDEAICDAIRSGEALVTGLESDIWMPR